MTCMPMDLQLETGLYLLNKGLLLDKGNHPMQSEIYGSIRT